METMTIDELNIICEELNARSKNIYDAVNDTPSWDQMTQADIDKLIYLNDEHSRYQRRLIYLIGKQKERQAVMGSSHSPVKDKRKADTGMYFITVSPPPEANLQEFIRATHQFMALKVIKDGSYVFEQRSETEDEMGRGFHTHILCQRQTKPSAFKKELKRIFLKFFRSDCFGQKQFFMENVEIAEKHKKIRYMKGEKYGKSKAKKCSMDKIWRKSVLLNDMYDTEQID